MDIADVDKIIKRLLCNNNKGKPKMEDERIRNRKMKKMKTVDDDELINAHVFIVFDYSSLS